MSGEAVVVSVLFSGPAGLAVLAGAGGMLAGQMVMDWIAEQRMQAEMRMREERKALTQWQSHHAAEQSRAADMAKRHERVRELLEGLSLGPARQQASGGEGPRSTGFVNTGEQSLQSRLAPLFASLPAEALSDADAPFVRLRQQMERLDERSDRGNAARLEDFCKTAEMTVSQYLDTLDRDIAARRALLEETESLLEEVLGYRHLPGTQLQSEELDALRANLLKLIAAGQATTASVALLRRKFDGLKSDIDRELQRRAVHEALQARLHNHLEELGYRTLQAEMGSDSTWEVPGGERVRVAVGEDLRLGFQLIHEREEHSSHALSERELAYLRQQEKRWCGDLHEVVRLLNEDGFALNIEFERETRDDAIPVVVIDDLGELSESDESADAPKRRELP